MATIGRLELSWAALQKHLLPRRLEPVFAGTRRTFAAGTVRPGDAVTCDIDGHHLVAGIPTTLAGQSESAGYGGGNVIDVTLAVTGNRDGSITADCHAGAQ